MLKTSCINSLIMKKLSLCGHGDKILIADGNYPLDAESGEAEKVYLGVSSGVPTVTQVLEALCGVANFEKAEIMMPDDGTEPEIFGEFREILGTEELGALGRYEFYEECNKPKVRLAISTGEKRVYANILLTVGVV
ncbi:MAG: RbsD or FucU transport [Ruminococcaceae bacterium]|nr:RbsD or FucU transport [Oscillospiraceae bacterium]